MGEQPSDEKQRQRRAENQAIIAANPENRAKFKRVMEDSTVNAAYDACARAEEAYKAYEKFLATKYKPVRIGLIPEAAKENAVRIGDSRQGLFVPATAKEAETNSQLFRTFNDVRNQFINERSDLLQKVSPAGIPENPSAVRLQEAMIEEHLAVKREPPKPPQPAVGGPVRAPGPTIPQNVPAWER